MRLLLVLLILLTFGLLGCKGQLLNAKDLTDLLEAEKGNSGGGSSTTSNANQNSTSGNASKTTDQQSLDYHGLTDSPTGTNTFGSAGSPAGTGISGR